MSWWFLKERRLQVEPEVNDVADLFQLISFKRGLHGIVAVAVQSKTSG